VIVVVRPPQSDNLMRIVGSSTKQAIDDVDAETPALPVSGDVRGEFRLKAVEPNCGAGDTASRRQHLVELRRGLTLPGRQPQLKSTA
jgi:hypothetical protein